MTKQRFTLDAYAARSCPLKTVNSFTPGLEAPRIEFPPPPFFHDADSIETDVYATLLAAVPAAVDLRRLRNSPSAEQEAAALEAMASGVPLVLAPLLPRDWEQHRSGRPSALLRVDDGYVPVQVKFHRVMESCSLDAPPLTYSTLALPLLRRDLPGRRYRWSGRLHTALQVAHYWRLLEATGHAASRPWAGIVGTERITPVAGGSRRQQLVITWLDLGAPLAAPNPATVTEPEAARRISTLERYDYEHTYRVGLASQALIPGAPPPLTPVMNRECAFCVWQAHCADQLAEDDLSLRIAKAPLDPHEVRTLRELGVCSVSDLATADLAGLLPRYLPRVAHRDGGEARLALAQRQARLLSSGVQLERTTTGPVPLPEHELEIDLDIETSSADSVYLWGFLVHDCVSGERRYHSVASFTDLEASSERQLAAEAFTWLRNITRGRDAAVYHYSDYETLRVHKLAGRLRAADGHAALLAQWMNDFTDEHFVDLFSIVRAHFFGANGLGLKVVATAATDFAWRDEEPGGLASQAWFADAVHADTEDARRASRQRVLEYNEDDVRATWHLRTWLRTLV